MSDTSQKEIIEKVETFSASADYVADAAELFSLLIEANELLRSTYQIAEREGENTNWTPFKTMIYDALKKQHKNLHPETYNNTQD